MKFKYKALLIIPLLGIAAIFFFFYHFGSNDARVLANFPAAYNKYDKAVSEFAKAVISQNQESPSLVDASEQKANQAFAELKTKASARISSLTKHDGEIMDAMLEISNVSNKEMKTLQAYKGTGSDSGQLNQELNELRNQRQADYARFRQLSGQ